MKMQVQKGLRPFVRSKDSVSAMISEFQNRNRELNFYKHPIGDRFKNYNIELCYEVD